MRGKDRYKGNYVCSFIGGLTALVALMVAIPIPWARVSAEHRHRCDNSPTMYVRPPNGFCEAADIVGSANVESRCVTWEDHGEWKAIDATLRSRGQSADFSTSADELWPAAQWFTIAAAILCAIVVLFSIHALYLHLGATLVSKTLNIALVSLAAAASIIGWSVAVASEQFNEDSYRKFYPLLTFDNSPSTENDELCDGELEIRAGFGLAVAASGVLLITIVGASA
jgi:hypothetical protein